MPLILAAVMAVVVLIFTAGAVGIAAGAAGLRPALGCLATRAAACGTCGWAKGQRQASHARDFPGLLLDALPRAQALQLLKAARRPHVVHSPAGDYDNLAERCRLCHQCVRAVYRQAARSTSKLTSVAAPPRVLVERLCGSLMLH